MHDLTVVKELTATNSFLTMDKDVKRCQVESYNDCTTTKYMTQLMDKCKCLPMQLKLSDKVDKV